MSRHFSRGKLISVVFMVIVISLIFVANPMVSSGQKAGGPVMFGMSYPDLIGEKPVVQISRLTAMRAIGITSIRVDANWSWVQPDTSNSFNWTPLDHEVSSIRSAGMSVDLILDGCPRWVASQKVVIGKPLQSVVVARFARWAANLAARYSQKGVKYFEVGNEPNTSQICQQKPDAAAYTADLIAAYKAIKKVDPSAFVISGGLAPGPSHEDDINPITFLKEMYAHGARGSFDALGFHPYSFPAMPSTYEPWSGWSEMDETNPSIRSIMEDNGSSNLPVWITEYGAPSNGKYAVGSKAQAEELDQAISYVRKVTWIGAFYIYTWQDSAGGSPVDNGFGLLTASGRPKPAYSIAKDLIG